MDQQYYDHFMRKWRKVRKERAELFIMFSCGAATSVLKRSNKSLGNNRKVCTGHRLFMSYLINIWFITTYGSGSIQFMFLFEDEKIRFEHCLLCKRNLKGNILCHTSATNSTFHPLPTSTNTLHKIWNCSPSFQFPSFSCVNWGVEPTVVWTLKSESEAISLSSSMVADVAEGLDELEQEKTNNQS